MRRQPSLTDAPSRPLEVFDVSVLGAADHLWLSVSCSQGSVFGVSRALPVWPESVGEPVEWLSRAVGHALPASGDQAKEIGQILTRTVFDVPDVGAMLLQARGAAAAVGGQLLIRVLAAPRDVASWPWELMLDPQRPDRFLTQARDVHVVRSARSRTYATRLTPIEPPMNLLMVMSSPLASGGADDTTPFDLYEEKRSLLAELQPLVDRGLLYVEVEDRPTVERIRSRIGRQRRGFHLFHYLGHAQPAGIRLEQPDGRGRLVKSEEFARLLQQMPDLRLAVFAGCETARPPDDSGSRGEWPGEMSAADYCVRDACPMVVGMQAVLPFGTERLFTRFFYQSLTGGLPVAEALRLARLAIADDEYTGGTLVNWAVPSLYVGGGLPGPVTDPTALAEVPKPIRRVGMRIGIRQGDLRFISRLSELRMAVDVLDGRGSTRLLQVVGPSGTGKTALLDRAVEELEPEVRYVFVSARRLLEESDPVGELGIRLADLLKLSGLRPPPRGELTAGAWWERILDTADDLRLAVVIDDGDALSEGSQGPARLLAALQALIDRRNRIRLAVTCSQPIAALTEHLRAGQAKAVRLEALGWPDVWAWIRRNLPALTRLEEHQLRAFYADLPHLEQWEQLSDVMVRRATLGVTDLPDVVAQIAQTLSVESLPPAGPPPVLGDRAALAASTEQSRRALRVAVAGPFTEGREQQFSRSVTQFAADYQVGGRVTGSAGDPAGSLAELVSLPTPFANGLARNEDLVTWMEAVREHAADVVVLDFGSERQEPALDPAVQRLVADGRLVIAAGGNSGRPEYPAWDAEVLAVGALEPSGELAGYSPYFADAGKPDLYAPARLVDSAISGLIENQEAQGTSMAALYAAAAAITVWATDRDLTVGELRSLLLRTAQPIETPRGRAHRLDVAAALKELRRTRILDILQWQSVELGQLVAESGLRSEVVLPLVDELIAEDRVRRQRTADTELIVDPQALTTQYRQLRAEPPGNRRTQRMQRIVDRVKELADQGRFTAAKVDNLWRGGDEAQRLTALAVTQAVPSLGSAAILVDGITASRSAFEQYQALLAATHALPVLDADGRSRLTKALHDVEDSVYITDSVDRARLVERLLSELENASGHS